jgi:hypothetical protein
MRSWFLGLWYLGLGLFVERYKRDIVLVEGIYTKELVTGFSPLRGFHRIYLVFCDCLSFNDPITCNC